MHNSITSLTEKWMGMKTNNWSLISRPNYPSHLIIHRRTPEKISWENNNLDLEAPGCSALSRESCWLCFLLWQKWSSWSHTLIGKLPQNDGCITSVLLSACVLCRPKWKSCWESLMSCVCLETRPSVGPRKLRRSSKPWRQMSCTSRRYESNCGK